MKEIIEDGYRGNKAKYTNTCPHCWCEYTYQKEDVICDILSGNPRVYCPCCGKENIVAILPGPTYTMIF